MEQSYTRSVSAQSTDYYPFGRSFENVNVAKNRYLYNGKELQDQMVGGTPFGWYDYGARFYDAEVPHFTSVDPMAEKYYDFSPYNYCAGNPISSVDVNGEWIYILYEGQRYKYDDGKLYQFQTEGDEQGTYTEYSAKDGSFLAGVTTGLNDMVAKSENGNGIATFFANDDNDAYVKQNDENTNIIDLGNSTNTIYLSPNLQGSDIPTEQGVQKSPFWLDIGHELSHRQDILQRGVAAKKEWLKNPDTGMSIPETEKYATHKENQMRQDVGLPLRTHYVRQGSGGWAPSKIIDRKGNSIYYPGVNYKPLKKNK